MYKAILKFLKGTKIKDLLSLDLFADNQNQEEDKVQDGKIVSKDGNNYVYKKSEKNPAVRRLFRVDDVPNNIAKESKGKEETVNKPSNNRPQSLKTKTAINYNGKTTNDLMDLFGSSNNDEPTEEVRPKEPQTRTNEISKIKEPQTRTNKGKEKVKDDEIEDLFSMSQKENENDEMGDLSKRKSEGGKEEEKFGDNNKIKKEPERPKDGAEEADFGAEKINGNKTIRININEKCKDILKKDIADITEGDKEILKQYSGRGGLNNDDVSLNEFFTRKQEAKFAWDMLGKFGFKGGEVLEPSSGIGIFIETAPRDTLCTGIEIDPTSAKIAEVLLGNKASIQNSSFERFVSKSKGGSYDAVIGNCPFGLRGASKLDDIDKAGIKKHEQYFVDRGLDELKEGGLFAMIVPTGIMDNQISNWRTDINKKADFLGAVRMPVGAFKHANATVTTDMVFFRKRSKKETAYLQNLTPEGIKDAYQNLTLDSDFITGNFFKNNPEFTIGTEKRGQFDTKIWTGDCTQEELEAVANLMKFETINIGDAVDSYKAPELHVGDLEQINGRVYRLNENHRWERLEDDELKDENSLIPDEVKKKLGIKNLAELETLRNDYALQLDLTREQLHLLGDKELSKGLDQFHSKDQDKDEKIRKGVVLGTAIKRFRNKLQYGDEVGEFESSKLKGLLEEYANKFGTDFKGLVGKSKEDPFLYLAGSYDSKGKTAKFYDDPFASFNIYQTSDTIGEIDPESITNITQYLYENGIRGELETIKSEYKGQGNVEELLLKEDSIFIDENGNYAPENEVCMGDVYVKLDKWREDKKEIKEDLETETDEKVRALLELKNEKLQRQINRLEEKAGTKNLEDMPIELKDCGGIIDIQYLNDFLKDNFRQLRSHTIIKDRGLFTLLDSSYREYYLLYANKRGGLDKEETKHLTSFINQRFGANVRQPQIFSLLNRLNGIATGLKDEKAKIFDNRFNELTEGFAKFLQNSDDAKVLEDKYNRLYNNYVQKTYSTAPIEKLSKFDYEKIIMTTPEGREITAREKAGDHIWQTVRRMYDQGKGLICHGVGLGKTLQGIMLTTLCKQTGRAKKPLIVTPKSVLINWMNEIDKWTKGVNYIVVGLKKNTKGKWVSCTSQEKALQLKDVEANDYDMVLMSRDTFGMIDFLPETKTNMIRDLVSKYYPDSHKSGKKGEQEAMKGEDHFATKLENRNAIKGVFFENLGIDMLVTDECHSNKNLLTMQDSRYSDNKTAGISGAESARAIHNYFVSKLIRSKTKEKGIYGLTATPISNSPLEVFNMMLPYAEKELEHMALNNMDEFVNRFAQMAEVITAEADGKVVEKQKFAGWRSPDVIRNQFYRFVDYKTADMVESVKANIKFPKEKPEHILGDLNEGQKELMNHCRSRLLSLKYRISDDHLGVKLDIGRIENAIDNEEMTQEQGDRLIDYFNNEYYPKYKDGINAMIYEGIQFKDDCYFSVQSDMIKIAADLDWYSEKSSDYSKKIDDKYVEKHNNIEKMKQLTESATGVYNSGGKQLIFAVNVNLHQKIKDQLVKSGIKPEEIAIMNAKVANTEAIRAKIADDYNAGTYKVVIGNYATMGEGINLNNYTSDIHHLQPTWNYLQIEQGNGRGIRQGNPLDNVNTHYYLSKGSVDGFMNDKITSKRDMVNKFLKGESNVWDDDVALDGDEMLIALAENPEQARKLVEAKKEHENKALKLKAQVSSMKDLDRYYDLKNTVSKIKDEDKESTRMRGLVEELNEVETRLIRNSEFKFKDAMNYDQKPIILKKFNEVMQAGTVLKGLKDYDEEVAVIESYKPYSGKITITRYFNNYSESRSGSVTLDEFSKIYGEHYIKSENDINSTYNGISKSGKYNIISTLPKDYLEKNRKALTASVIETNGRWNRFLVKDSKNNKYGLIENAYLRDDSDYKNYQLVFNKDDDFIEALGKVKESGQWNRQDFDDIVIPAFGSIQKFEKVLDQYRKQKKVA